MRGLLLTMMLLAAVPGYSAEQFDLVCKGRARSSPIGRWEPAQITYKVDLANRVWCMNSCEALKSFADVEPNVLVLNNNKDERSRKQIRTTIDRSTGAWNDVFSVGPPVSVYVEREGLCEPAAFTGMPFKPKF